MNTNLLTKISKKFTRLIGVIGILLVVLAITGFPGCMQDVQAKTPTESLNPSTVDVTVAGCIDSTQIQGVLDAFTTLTGYTTQYTQTCNYDDYLYCTANQSCPDVAFTGWPGLLAELGRGGDLVDLGPFINSTTLSANYSDEWIELGTIDQTLYGVWFNAANKSLIWYDPAEFTNHGWTTPADWSGLLALSDQILTDTATPPWSIGNESGAASGWPLTDWFEDILLRSAGPDIYDQLVAHTIPWTHPQVVAAMTYFGNIFGNEAYQLGGKNGTINTSFIDAMYPPFEQPPSAYLHRQASFAQLFISDHFPSQTPGVDYAVFHFPDINPAYTNAVMGVGEAAMMYHDTPAAQALINYLITTDAAELWIVQGNLSPNRSADVNLYPDIIRKTAAIKLANADIFRFDLTDQLPGYLNEYVWSQMDDLVMAAPDPAAMWEVLARIEGVASPRQVFLPLLSR